MRKKFFLSCKSNIMSLLRILAKKKTPSTLTSSNQQRTSTSSTPNIELPSLFPTQEESGNSSFMCYLLGTFFFTVLLQVTVNVNRMEKINPLQ